MSEGAMERFDRRRNHFSSGDSSLSSNRSSNSSEPSLLDSSGNEDNSDQE